MGMRRNEKIQIIALYGSLVLIIIGVAIPEAMNYVTYASVSMLVLSWVVPILEKVKVMDENNGKKAMDLVWIDNNRDKPVNVSLVIDKIEQLIPNLDPDSESEKKIINIKRNKDILVRFMPAYFVDEVMTAIDKLTILSRFYCYYILLKYPETINGEKIEHILFICEKSFDKFKKFQDKVPAKGYDINLDTLIGTSILIEKVGDLPFIFLDYSIESSYEKKKQTDENLIDAEKLNSIKDQVILTLLNFHMPAAAAVRKADNLVEMHKENFEDALQTIQKLKFLNKWRPPAEIHWSWKFGWILTFILIIVLIYILPQIMPTTPSDAEGVENTTTTTTTIRSMLTWIKILKI